MSLNTSQVIKRKVNNMIIIPERLEQKLSDNKEMLSIVWETITEFKPIIEANKLEFFPDYTDHGVLHINKVLKIVDMLIPGDFFEKLTGNDIGAIILAAVLHDLGMHISYDGFNELVYGAYSSNRIEDLDNSSWSNSWEDYLSESKIWSGKKIESVINDSKPPRVPPKNCDDATGKDKKFVGEFLRRNHPRLAHEIAEFGFPCPDGKVIKFGQKLGRSERFIIGFIARSHGMYLWDTLSPLEREFGSGQGRNIIDIHVVYLMVILRLADYLDFDKERANRAILRTKRMNNKISEMEWLKHNAVEYIQMSYQDDPESIYISVKELESSKVYIALNLLITEMQKELDTCWAVLGKVYQDRWSMGVRFRRIHTNLNDKENFLCRFQFVPERVKFDSNEELLKLLVAPLYGDNPSFGVRELIQNAVDACIEREKICEQLTDVDYEPKVLIEIKESDDTWFIINDNGIGMDKNILINFFLKAGASFRKSDYWKKEFLNDENHSVIPRSGRFGVGVFASFLIGNELEVTTQKLNSEIRYSFEAGIDTDQIEVIKSIDTERQYGTKIRIKILPENVKKLKEQFNKAPWYRLKPWHKWYHSISPALEIVVPETWTEYNYGDSSLAVDLNPDITNESWNKVSIDEYNKVEWRYGVDTELLCNGIRVPEHYSIKDYPIVGTINKPTISVVDYDGNFPLTLDRNGISGDMLPFEKELLENISQNIFADIFTASNISVFGNEKLTIGDVRNEHPAIKKDYRKFVGLLPNDYIFTREGYSIAHGHNLRKMSDSKITRVWINNNCNEINDSAFLAKINHLSICKDLPTAIEHYNEIFDIKDPMNNGGDFDFRSVRVFMNKSQFNRLFNESVKRVRSQFKNGVSIEYDTENWVCFTYGNPPATDLTVQDIERNSNSINILCEHYFKDLTPKDDKGELSSSILDNDFIGRFLSDNFTEYTFIPYDLEERIKVFPTIAKSLGCN